MADNKFVLLKNYFLPAYYSEYQDDYYHLHVEAYSVSLPTRRFRSMHHTLVYLMLYNAVLYYIYSIYVVMSQNERSCVLMGGLRDNIEWELDIFVT